MHKISKLKNKLNNFNKSFQKGIYCACILKIARITPIDKGGIVTDPSNYRPISALSAFSQILEKLVHLQLVSYIEKYELLYQFQYGIRKGKSTEQAIAEITDCLKKFIDKNVYTFGIFLDFCKAFDTVDYTILLKKTRNIWD